MEEIEVKFLGIDSDLIIQKLEKLGANKIFSKLYRRKVFDHVDWRLDKDNSWLRLRDEGEKITLAFKKRINPGSNGCNDQGMEEREIEVSDFEKTADILLSVGLIEKHYVENKRIRYVLDDIEFDIDFYPQLEPYLEIEAPSWDKVDEAIKLLELNPNDKKIFSTSQVYSQNGINMANYQKVTFEEMVLK